MKNYAKFILIGLLNAIFVEFAIVPQKIITEDFYGTLLLHIFFLSLSFIVSRFLVSKKMSLLKEYLLFYYIFGFLGLFVVEWIIVGNLVVSSNILLNILTQIFMFSFWAGVAFLPKVLLDERLEVLYREKVIKKIAFLFIPFITLAVGLYLFSSNFNVWRAVIVVFYISLNTIYFQHLLEVSKDKYKS